MTEYAIRSLKTGKTYFRCTGGLSDWCMLGEGELRFRSMTEAELYALSANISDYEVVPV